MTAFLVRFTPLAILAGVCVLAQGAAPSAALQDPASVVRQARLDPGTPLFVPVHPRIATTVRFPNPVGEPMGTGFVDAEAFQQAAAGGSGIGERAEYLISFEQGDTHFTVQPLQRAEILNLNVPYEGATFVLYFYVVDQPLGAVASLLFSDRPPGAPGGSSAPHRTEEAPLAVQRQEKLPEPAYKVATPARLEGLLRKLRVVHAARRGPELADVARSMKLQVALSAAEEPGEESRIRTAVTDSGDHELILLRAVRDPALDALGFILLMRNKSARELVFDLRSFSARCGAALYNARVVDASATLKPGEVRAAYFVIVGAGDGRPGHLSAENDWRLSVAQVVGRESANRPAPPEGTR